MSVNPSQLHLVAQQLTLQEELVKALFTAVTGAAALALAGWFAADSWGARKGRRDEEARQREQAAQNEYELRSGMVETTVRAASVMFIACQHQARAGWWGWAALRWRRPLAATQLTSSDLHAKYHAFNVESKVTERLIDARYEPAAWVIRGEPGHREINRKIDPQTRWHQISDLLALYYFSLVGEFYGNSLRSNALGYDNKFHSGIGPEDMPTSMRPTRKEQQAFRERLREEYAGALGALQIALMQAPLRDLTPFHSRASPKS